MDVVECLQVLAEVVVDCAKVEQVRVADAVVVGRKTGSRLLLAGSRERLLRKHDDLKNISHYQQY